ncbi:MAG: hypothetical protein C0605_14835 [Hyphomicrobiales bacterium]|nr:MAG: hypothetical protein C0605_14835 [Hyphomicrobiales bacterium]
MPFHAAYQLPIEALDIVVVDDIQSMRQIFHSVLMAFGVRRLRFYANGRAALNEMVNDPPNMLITDWHMKPMDGVQLLRNIRKAEMMPLSLLTVIMVTGFASRSLVQDCFDAGVQQFLVKPISPKSVYERIQWILRDSRPLVRRGGGYVIGSPVTAPVAGEDDGIDFLDLAGPAPDAAEEPDEFAAMAANHWQI